jgi:hypothetical protein
MLTKTDLSEISKIVTGSEARVKKELGTKITKVQKTLEEMDKFLDKELMADRRRIIRIEGHLNFPKN